MDLVQAIVVAIVEGITEFLPVSSTAHMIFMSTFFGVQEDAFVKMFQMSIQFGAILSVVVLYWRKFINFKSFNFYLKLFFAIIPAMVLGKIFDEKIEAVLEKPIPIAIVLIVGGIILLFVDKLFKQNEVTKEEDISIKKAVTIGFWQCLAMMPGVSRSAASIIGGMQQKLSRDLAAEFSFFLAVPTMFAVTCYSIILKDWGYNGTEQKGYEMILANSDNMLIFAIGNIVAFFVALLAIKFFIEIIKKYGFKLFGYYRIVMGSIMLIYLSLR